MCGSRRGQQTPGASSPSMSCLRVACRQGRADPRAQRPPAPTPPQRLRSGPPKHPARRPLPRRRQGLRSDRGPEPPLGGGALGLHGLGRALPRGHSARHCATCPSRPAHPPHHPARPRRHDAPSGHPRHHTRPALSSTSRPPSTPSRCAPPPAAPSRSTASTCASSPRPSPATGAGTAPPSSPRSSPPARRPPRASSRTWCSTSSCAAATSTLTSTSPTSSRRQKTIPDFRWPEQRLVLEADSATWHDNPLAREDDAERQALLEAHGERVTAGKRVLPGHLGASAPLARRSHAVSGS